MAVLFCLFQETTFFFLQPGLRQRFTTRINCQENLVEMESEKLEIPAQAQKPQFSLRKVLFSNNFLSLELSFQRNLTK